MGERKNNARRRIPFVTRSLALVAAIAFAWPLRDTSWTSVILPSLSPFIALGSVLAVRAATLLTLLALPAFILALVIPKFLCRYVCPVGFLQELIRFRIIRRLVRLPPIGKWLAMATLGAACLGYPFFLWLDPFAIFNGFMNAWRIPLTLASLLPAIGLPAVLVFNLFLPGVWCARMCPLGAMQEFLAIPRRWRRQKPEPVEGRRAFIATCAGIAGSLAAGKIHGHDTPLRPPGSIDESRFAGVCVRCGNCTQVCPSKIIRPDLGMHGVLGLFAPVLHFESGYCRETCNRCNDVCPSGAITRLPLAAKNKRAIGLAKIDLDTCLLANSRECTACITNCPFAAIEIRSPDGGFSSMPFVLSDKCTGCGACEAVCPVRPVRSIRVIASASQRRLL